MHAIIYYDGDCPFCTRYARYQRLQRTVGDVQLVDLRSAHADRERLQSQGFDLDKGMVLDLDGRLYPGDEAVHRLALLSTDNTFLARLNRALLGSRAGAALAYPLLRLGRNASLLAMGRTPLATDGAADRAWQTLFCMAWGLFAYMHLLVYAFDYDARMYPSSWAVGGLGVVLLLFPFSRRVFLALLSCMALDAWLHMPVLSNHSMMQNVFVAGLLLSGGWHALRGSRWRAWLADAAPIGRATLVTMYVFGVFHKVNRDFLDPAVSCAPVLWREMPAPLRWIDFPAFDLATIYGTLVVETVILLCLLFKRSRHLGILLGIGFHALLALSGYALYAAFSMLSIALHLLFLDRASALQVVESPLWRRITRFLQTPLGLMTVGAWCLALAALAWHGSYDSFGLLWLPPIVVLCVAIARHGNATPDANAGAMLWSRLWWLNALSLLFFIGCASPYLGLKTGQSINMFANLQLEGGRSNHLVFRDPPGPFGYLADTVEIVDAGSSQYLMYIKEQGLRITYYDLLDELERNPGVQASYRRGDTLLQRQGAATLGAEFERVLHPRWFRNVFHFTPVDLTSPKPCALDR